MVSTVALFLYGAVVMNDVAEADKQAVRSACHMIDANYQSLLTAAKDRIGSVGSSIDKDDLWDDIDRLLLDQKIDRNSFWFELFGARLFLDLSSKEIDH
jgi:hypothetical protein